MSTNGTKKKVNGSLIAMNYKEYCRRMWTRRRKGKIKDARRSK